MILLEYRRDSHSFKKLIFLFFESYLKLWLVPRIAIIRVRKYEYLKELKKP